MSSIPISHKCSTIAASRPEITELKFIYNYFVPDEAGNDMTEPMNPGNPISGYMMSEAAAQEFQKQKDFKVTVPRLVSISIQPGQILGSTPSSKIKDLLGAKDENNKSLLDQFLMKDIDLNYPNFMGTRIGDGEIIGRIARLSKHLHEMKTGEKTDDGSRIEETVRGVFDDEDRVQAIQDCILSTDPVAPTRGDGFEKLSEPFGAMKKVNFLTPLPSESPFLKAGGYSVDLKLATQYYDDALAYGSNFCSTPLTQFALTNYDRIKSLSSNAPFKEDIYGDEDSLIPLRFEKVNSHQEPVYLNAGIVVQKYEVTEEGLQHVEDSVYPVEENTSNFTIFDPCIKYGVTYGYCLRELYMITATVYAELPDLGAGIYKTDFFIEGSPSPVLYTSCFEKIAPRPPEALFVRRGLEAEGIMLEWQFPTNPQRDIKKFQVFRRETLLEPFFLLKEIDFNDADPVIAGPETIDKNLKEYPGYPKTVYYDLSFAKNDKYIYSVCSVDAHGFSSPLSAQVQVSIDKFRNLPVIKTISPAGAPKQYPNMYVSATDSENNDQIRLTEDIIRVSGYDEVDVFFEPEAQRVKTGNKVREVYSLAHDANIEITSTDEGFKPNPKFILQFLNLDNGKSQDVNILIRDVRLDKSDD